MGGQRFFLSFSFSFLFPQVGWFVVFVFRSFPLFALILLFFSYPCESAQIMLAGPEYSTWSVRVSCQNCCAVGLASFRLLVVFMPGPVKDRRLLSASHFVDFGGP